MQLHLYRFAHFGAAADWPRQPLAVGGQPQPTTQLCQLAAPARAAYYPTWIHMDNDMDNDNDNDNDIHR